MEEVECEPKQAGWFFHLIRVEWEFSLIWIFTVQWQPHVQGSGFSKTTQSLCRKVIPGWNTYHRLHTFPLHTLAHLFTQRLMSFMFWAVCCMNLISLQRETKSNLCFNFSRHSELCSFAKESTYSSKVQPFRQLKLAWKKTWMLEILFRTYG